MLGEILGDSTLWRDLCGGVASSEGSARTTVPSIPPTGAVALEAAPDIVASVVVDMAGGKTETSRGNGRLRYHSESK